MLDVATSRTAGSSRRIADRVSWVPRQDRFLADRICMVLLMVSHDMNGHHW